MELSYATRGQSSGNGGNASINRGPDRSRGWTMRSYFMTAALYPDTCPTAADQQVKTDWLAALPPTLASHVTNSLGNNLGIPSNAYNAGAYSPYYVALPTLGVPLWMVWFYAQSMGFAWDLDILTGAGKTSLQTLRDFLYKAVVGVLGTSSGWCYRQFHTYATCVGTLDPAFAYPNSVDSSKIVWNADWAACYAQASVTPVQDSSTGLPTAAFWIDSSIVCSVPDTIVTQFGSGTGYASNLAPALAYAVDHSATGAAAAYARWSGATNYQTFDALRTQGQQWAVIPR